ncbi:hypothetical protein BJ878DRAFT_497578 [Calycina marina]|uniref:VPS37 C-terminal domain-containing protein n=1 Tax=Calycina marina TaxID=1763456 RepID=A0A9P7Z6I8_9HELO|nr:hypothetical protein BJ878DRAFT_497578 [Calycina marina]
MSTPPTSFSYNSQSYAPNTPPLPPPKPRNEESSANISRRSTPAGAGPPLPPPPPEGSSSYNNEDPRARQARFQSAAYAQAQVQQIQDPGDQWLPKILEDKSKQDLADALSRPEILAALAHSETTAHPLVAASQQPLQAALQENVALASHLNELEQKLNHLRALTQAQLLSTHALERQWKQKQSEMDRALAPFSPSSLYQRLSSGVQEQEMVCRALEESFLEGDGGVATEREAAEWVRRFREAKKLYYSRREMKERWDEGRVGGWR